MVASLIDVCAEAELGGDLIVQSEIKLENCFSVLEIKLRRWERCHIAAGQTGAGGNGYKLVFSPACLCLW